MTLDQTQAIQQDAEREALKPCPFCGKRPEIHKHFREDMHSLIHRCKILGPIIFDFGSKDRHIKNWNTRA